MAAPMANEGSRAHQALIAVLIMARESEGLTQREVISRMLAWLSWEQSTLAKVETGRRILAFEEAKALREIYGTDHRRANRRLRGGDVSHNAYNAGGKTA